MEENGWRVGDEEGICEGCWLVQCRRSVRRFSDSPTLLCTREEVEVVMAELVALAKLNDVICGGFNFLVEQLSTMQKMNGGRSGRNREARRKAPWFRMCER